MSKIKIEWLTDFHDCETCGGAYASGAIVEIDDDVVIDLAPVAACFGGRDYTADEVYARIFNHLGHELENIE